MEIVEDIFIKKLLFKLGTGDNQFERSVYLTLIRGRKNCLIDTGTADNFDNIVNFCRENGVTVADLDLIGRGRDAGYPAFPGSFSWRGRTAPLHNAGGLK